MSHHSDPPKVDVPAGYMWHGQFRHGLLLACLLPGAWAIAGPSLGDGEWLGVSDRWWFASAIAAPVLQQVAVALLWRAQLCYGLLTRAFGEAGFVVWGVIFFPLLVARPLLVLAVGLSDVGSLPIPTGLGIGLWGIGLLCRSQTAIAVALFAHAYIWVHWYCTEQPDGVVLYGRSPDED